MRMISVRHLEIVALIKGTHRICQYESEERNCEKQNNTLGSPGHLYRSFIRYANKGSDRLRVPSVVLQYPINSPYNHLAS